MSDVDRISKSVEEDRARLASSLDALTETVNPRSLADEVSTAANDMGGDLADKAWQTLRQNPAGGVLVAIGVGLLAGGTERRPPSSQQTRQATATEPNTTMTSLDERMAATDRDLRAAVTGEPEPTPEASKMRAALESGLEKLPSKARQRVIKARLAAISAQESIERQTRRTARQTKGFVYEQPLTAGALALGFGVVAAALLPGTRREDALMGRRRDALLADARNALEEEMLKLKHQAEDTLAEKTRMSEHQHRA